MMNDKKNEQGMEYVSLALYAFLGLGCEVPLAFWIEPMLYGHGLSEFTLLQSVIHWCVTCIIWLLFARGILGYAKRELKFTIADTTRRIGPVSWLLCIGLLVAVTALNYQDVGAIKPYHEFLALGTVKFIFQHIYYLVETLLFTLIIVFGQIAMEKWTKRENIPFGGIIVGCTWGLAHIFTKGSLWIGLEGMFIGFLFGAAYLILKRDMRKTYVVLALAFIL